MDSLPSDPQHWDRWILSSRPDLSEHRRSLDPRRPARWITEEELQEDGRLAHGLTLFLTNRECPWRCLMCDLWRETTVDRIPDGSVVDQITGALQQAPAAEWIKLYNAGSFFDAGAIPTADLPAIARLVQAFQKLIVECHPRLIAPRVTEFSNRLVSTRLEVALGLESAHPEVLRRLNKGMTLDDFRRAAGFLVEAGISVRAFVLVKPPFQEHHEALEWALRTVDVAFAAGASVVSLIPTRTGNGALEALQGRGLFSEPSLELLEVVMRESLGRRRGRVFADIWDLGRFHTGTDLPSRRLRLERANRTQVWTDL
jgi:archaeosine synthase beta-subunit